MRSLVFLVACAGCMLPPRLEPMPSVLGAPDPSPPERGSLWRADRSANYLFKDVRARFPGDVLTVVLQEQTKGAKQAATDTSASSSILAQVRDFFGIAAGDVPILPGGFTGEAVIDASTEMSRVGEGETTRAGSLTGTVTVTVIEVDGAGNLRVQGEKTVRVNEEDQHLVLTGRVRPEDIATDNSVLSTRLADARISYFGYGVVGDKQRVPIAHRLMDWVWPF